MDKIIREAVPAAIKRALGRERPVPEQSDAGVARNNQYEPIRKET